MKKTLYLSVALIFVLALAGGMLLGCEPEEEVVDEVDPEEEVVDDEPDPEDVAEAEKFLTLASGSPGGVYYPLGAGLAQQITGNIDGVVCQSESTGASVENIRLVGAGETDLAMVMGNVAFDAIEGQADFEGDAQPIMALFNMYPGAQKFFVDADTDIYELEDFAGHEISVDAAGSGSEVMARTIFEFAGIMDDIDAVNLSMAETSEALRDGLIDGGSVSLAYPTAHFEELHAMMDIRYVDLDEDFMDAAIEEYPFFFKGVVPKEAHEEHMDEDHHTLFVGNEIIVHEDFDEDLAYEITRHMFQEETIEELIGIHAQAENMDIQNAPETAAPLHPGAERFFQEEGIID